MNECKGLLRLLLCETWEVVSRLLIGVWSMGCKRLRQNKLWPVDCQSKPNSVSGTWFTKSWFTLEVSTDFWTYMSIRAMRVRVGLLYCSLMCFSALFTIRGGQLTTFHHDEFNVSFAHPNGSSVDYSPEKFSNWTLKVVVQQFFSCFKSFVGHRQASQLQKDSFNI